MPDRRRRRRDLRGRWKLVRLPIALITATALMALAVTLITAKAEGRSRPTLLCSRDDRGPASPMRPGAPARPLVPHGALMLTICNYNGMNARRGTPQFGLLGTYRTRRVTTIRRVTAELDAIKPLRRGVAYNCPFDDGSQATLSFNYGSADVVVDVGTNGCNGVSSGHIRRLALGAPVIAQIEKLARPVTGLRWAAATGYLRLCGGPSGRCQIENYGNGDRVLVTRRRGPWLAMAQIEHGRFHLRIASGGTLTFAFYTGNRLVRKLSRNVRIGSTTHVVFPISIR